MKDTQTVLLQQVRVIDPESPYHGQLVDIALKDGKIESIDTELSGDYQRYIKGKDLHVSPGWMDLRANFRDPGEEDKEDLPSGSMAALSAGFTAVGISPGTMPPIDSKADVEYILRASESSPLHLYPMGAITQGLKGQDLSEMYDLLQAGAVGFSQGENALENSAVLRLAMLYSRELAPPLHLTAYDPDLLQDGQMHEGKISTQLGLRGFPVLAEEIGLLRNFHLAHYAEAGIHCQRISSAAAVNLLREKRRSQAQISADVNLANLLLTDKALLHYDRNLKVYPPLREESDRQALLQGLREGLIDVITSDHLPQRSEDKYCEYERAAWGAAGMETMFGALWQELHPHFALEEILPAMSRGPREVLGLEVPVITAGAEAELTLFDPHQEWSLKASEAQSKAVNNPWYDQPLRGRAVGIINKGITVLWEERLR